jgi:hypothetical protein
MVDFRMLNGKPKATAIVRFDHSAVLIVRGKKEEFKSLEEMKIYKDKNGLEVNIEYIHPASMRPENVRKVGKYPEIGSSFINMVKEVFKI